MWRRFLAGLAALGMVSLLAPSCGYHLVGTSSNYLPPELRTLHVTRFKNTTTWADMDQRLTEAVSREWVRRRRFELVEDRSRADLELTGNIQAVIISPVRFDDAGRASEYQMTLVASMKLLDIRGEKPVVLWEDKGFSRRTSYEVDTSAADYFDRQIEAIERVSNDFARSLVSSILEGF